MIRRTLTRTNAPSFSSFSRIVPQVASANCVCASPMRRWWVGPILAGLVYLFFGFLMPALLLSSPSSHPQPLSLPAQVFGGVSARFAPWLSLLVLLIWGGAELTKFVNRQRLDNQKDLESIGRLSWLEFEKLLCEAFRRQGYSVEHRGGAGPDGGIDLMLRREGQKALVQCKHWKYREHSGPTGAGANGCRFQ